NTRGRIGIPRIEPGIPAVVVHHLVSVGVSMSAGCVPPVQSGFTGIALRPAAPLKKMVEALEAADFLERDAAHRDCPGRALLFVAEAILAPWTERRFHRCRPYW